MGKARASLASSPSQFKPQNAAAALPRPIRGRPLYLAAGVVFRDSKTSRRPSPNKSPREGSRSEPQVPGSRSSVAEGDLGIQGVSEAVPKKVQRQ
jgi:hypothetical protein